MPTLSVEKSGDGYPKCQLPETFGISFQLISFLARPSLEPPSYLLSFLETIAAGQTVQARTPSMLEAKGKEDTWLPEMDLQAVPQLGKALRSQKVNVVISLPSLSAVQEKISTPSPEILWILQNLENVTNAVNSVLLGCLYGDPHGASFFLGSSRFYLQSNPESDDIMWEEAQQYTVFSHLTHPENHEVNKVVTILKHWVWDGSSANENTGPERWLSM